MKFVNLNYLRDYFSNKRVALIGSAPTVIDNVGATIDSFDLIIRINNYKIIGYQNNVGTRTDVFYSFFGSSIRKTVKELQQDGVKLIMCKCPNSKPIRLQ